MEENNIGTTLEKLVDVNTAARLLGVSRSTVDRIVASGALAYYVIGKSKKFSVRDLENYIKRSHVEPEVVIEKGKNGVETHIRRAKRKVCLRSSRGTTMEVEV